LREMCLYKQLKLQQSSTQICFSLDH
jgi:hypothetical protein